MALQGRAGQVRDREDQRLKDRIAEAAEKLAFPANGKLAPEESRKKVVKKITDAAESLSKTDITVYGSIYVKTDGDRLITAFRIESESETKRWYYCEYSLTANGTLIPEHEVAPD